MSSQRRMIPMVTTAAVLVLLTQAPAWGQNICRDLYKNRLSESQKQMLLERYGVAENLVEVTDGNFPVIFKMDDHSTLRPAKPQNQTPVRELKKYDVVIVGGGPAGLTTALYLAEGGKSVLVLERNEKAGGLGMGSELKGVRAGGGAAYSAGPDGAFEYGMFKKIGLGDYKKKISIQEPIDSYLWKGKLYKGIWEEHTLHELPQSFALFKHALLKLDKQGAGKEEGPLAEWADSMDMATLVRKMPELVTTWGDKESKTRVAEFLKDENVDKKDPMKDVIDLLNLYGRSALGGEAHKISARQFIDFYTSEIYTRYTGTLGTGTVSEALLNTLQKKFSHLVEVRTSTPVAEIENLTSSTKTLFVQDGVLKEVIADRVVFSAPLSLAPKLIKNLDKQDPEKTKLIQETQMTDYAVHVVRVKGHPYRATYDTWAFNNNNPKAPTDYILGRWQDRKMYGYEGFRDFKKDPADDFGVISVYQPLGPTDKTHFEKNQNIKMVDEAVKTMLNHLSPLAKENNQKIEVELVESYRWPDSIHIVRPGYLKHIPVLARQTGRIHYANNTVAAPELETAMARGAREAIKILEETRAEARLDQAQ